MFVLLLIFLIFSCCFLAWSYNKIAKSVKPMRFLVYINCLAWLIIYIIAMLISNYLSVIQLPFNELNTTMFSDVIDSNYISNFIQLSLIYLIFIALYLLIIKKLIKPYWLMAAIGIISIVLYYPGIPNQDTNNLYDYFLTNQYKDWQPPLYTIWWHIFHFYGAAFLVNNISYYLGLSYISYYLYKQNKSWQNSLLIIFSLNPIYFSQLNIVLKDTLFAGLCIDIFAIYLLLITVETKLYKYLLSVATIIISFILIGIRYNAVLATIGMMSFIIFYLLQQFKWNNLSKICMALIASFVLNFILVEINMFVAYNILNAQKSYSLSLVLQNDMANIECNTNHQFKIPDQLFIDPQYADILRQNMCEPGKELNQYNYDPLFINNWSSGSQAILVGNKDKEIYTISKKYWFNAVTQYPATYLAYRLRFFLNDLFQQYYIPAAAVYNSNMWPTNLASIDTYNPYLLAVQTIIANISYDNRQYVKYVLSLFILCGTIACLFYLCLQARFSPAWVILTINISVLFGWYLTSGEHAARFFLFNDIATLLAIIII